MPTLFSKIIKASRTNAATELENGRIQTWYGHSDARMEIEKWLEKTYGVDSQTRRRVQDLANRFLQDGPKDVLEIGSASGDLSTYFASLYPNHRYTVSDISQIQLERFLPRVQKWFKISYPFKTVAFAAESIPFPDESFDLIFIKAAVHHFDDRKKAFAEIRRVLKKGGKVIFIHDPVCLNIPVVRELHCATFGLEDRVNGSNCRIYPFKTYLSWGKGYADVVWEYDRATMHDIKANTGRRGLKRLLFSVIEKNPLLFRWFYLYRFGVFTFIFTK